MQILFTIKDKIRKCKMLHQKEHRGETGAGLTQTQGCLRAWSAVILLAGLMVNI